ncbi:MAG: hypothetical protein H0V17_36015 [Deltaproteobacteria bacterium]|nr:hypothetical protein [Deltaproteobacteria bacterium]
MRFCLATWFALCPDPAALDRRLRAAARAYLATTPDAATDEEVALIAAVDRDEPPLAAHLLRMRWFASCTSPERRCAVGILIAETTTADLDFGNVPMALLAELGNPFVPRQ